MIVVKNLARWSFLCLVVLLFLGSTAWLLHLKANSPTVSRWSDSATWQGHLPKLGADVTIPRGHTVILDVSPAPLARLTVEGTLIFADKNLHLEASAITVPGRFVIGSASAPFRHQAVVTLIGGPEAPDDKAFSITGDLEIHGAPCVVPWTHLAATAPAGARQITLAQAAPWHIGDRIVLSPTGYDDREAETASVTAVQGPTLTLAKPLQYTHFGQVTDGVDERAEVGLLTRNIIVQGDAASDKADHGGELMIMDPGTAHLENAEFRRMGQSGRLGRYPIHFHLAGALPGAYVRNCSIHHCYNRAVTIHGTDDVTVSGNVAYDIIGHCYFLEDGAETGNVLEDNLGILTRRPAKGRAVLASDLTPATFWITNPENTVIGNVAAGSDGDGFWYDLPVHPTGPCDTPENDRRIHPRRTALGVFRGNVAHSNDNDGLLVDNGANPPGVFGAPNYDPPREAAFADMTSYKNRRRGMWLRGSRLLVTGARVADNAIGITLAGSRSEVDHSWIVGVSDNHSGPPKPSDPHFALIGYEFYDGLVGAQGDTFVNFQPTAMRGAGALGYLRWSPFFIDPRNWVSGARFVHAQRVFLPPHPTPTDSKLAPKSGSDGYRSALFVDRDGSVTGQPGTHVMIATTFLRDSHTVLRPAWGAMLSDAPVGRLFVDDKDPHPASIGPVRVTRLDGPHPTQTLWGIPADSGPNWSFQTTVLTGHRYALAFHGALPAHLRLTLRLCRPGDWIVVTLPARFHQAPIRLVARPDGDNARAVAEITRTASIEADRSTPKQMANPSLTVRTMSGTPANRRIVTAPLSAQVQ